MLNEYKDTIYNMSMDELKNYLIELGDIIKKEKLILIVDILSIMFGSYIDINLFLNDDVNVSYNILLTFIVIVLSLNFDYFVSDFKSNKKLLKKIENEMKAS